MRTIGLGDNTFWNSLHFTDKLQKNLGILYKKLGNRFNIQYKRNVMPVFFTKVKSLNGGNTYFFMKYGVKTPIGKKLYPFKIQMYYNTENIKLEDVNDVYINNINAIDKDDYKGQKSINGSTVVEMVILLLKRLHVENAYLNDGASITCETDKNIKLTPFKLLEKRRTFYMKFGFIPLLNSIMLRDGRYKNINSFIKMVDKSIDKISKIDMKDVHLYMNKIIHLINKIYINNDFENVDIYNFLPNNFEDLKMDKKNNKDKLEKYRLSCIDLEKCLPKSGNLLNWMKKIFYTSCKEYKLLLEVMKPNFNAIVYNKKIYKMKYDNDFFNLEIYTRLDYKLEL